MNVTDVTETIVTGVTLVTETINVSNVSCAANKSRGEQESRGTSPVSRPEPALQLRERGPP